MFLVITLLCVHVYCTCGTPVGCDNYISVLTSDNSVDCGTVGPVIFSLNTNYNSEFLSFVTDTPACDDFQTGALDTYCFDLDDIEIDDNSTIYTELCTCSGDGWCGVPYELMINGTSYNFSWTDDYGKNTLYWSVQIGDFKKVIGFGNERSCRRWKLLPNTTTLEYYDDNRGDYTYPLSPTNCYSSLFHDIGCSSIEYCAFYCNEIFWSDPQVCSGHGSCIGNNTCECDERYHGWLCEMAYCGDDETNNHIMIETGNRKYASGSENLILGLAREETEFHSFVLDLPGCPSQLNYSAKDVFTLDDNKIEKYYSDFDDDNEQLFVLFCYCDDDGWSANMGYLQLLGKKYYFEYELISHEALVWSYQPLDFNPPGSKSCRMFELNQATKKLVMTEEFDGLNTSTSIPKYDCYFPQFSDVCGAPDCSFTCNELLWNDPLVCSGHGDCIDHEVCNCTDFGVTYFGKYCQDFKCFGNWNNDSLNVCSGHGNCNDNDSCICINDYIHPEIGEEDCSSWLCNDKRYHFQKYNRTYGVCHGFGNCTSPNNCSCDDGYEGSDCEHWDCNSIDTLNTEFVCSGNGNCIDIDECVCTNINFTGPNCNIFKCYSISMIDILSVCSGNGACVGIDDCFCDSNYELEDCSKWYCGIYEFNSTDPNLCSGHGICKFPDNCECLFDYKSKGDNGKYLCDTHFCGAVEFDDEQRCNGRGVCESPNNCNCFDTDSKSHYLYVGRDCEIKLGKTIILARKKLLVIYLEILEENLDSVHGISSINQPFHCSRFFEVIDQPQPISIEIKNILKKVFEGTTKNCSISNSRELTILSGLSQHLKIPISHLTDSELNRLLSVSGGKIYLKVSNKTIINFEIYPNYDLVKDLRKQKYTMRSFSKAKDIGSSTEDISHPSFKAQTCKKKLHLEDQCMEIHKCYKSSYDSEYYDYYSVGYLPHSEERQYYFTKFYFKSLEVCEKGEDFQFFKFFTLVSCFGSGYDDYFQMYELCAEKFNSMFFETDVFNYFMITTSPMYLLFVVLFIICCCCTINLCLFCNRKIAKWFHLWPFDWFIQNKEQQDEEKEEEEMIFDDENEKVDLEEGQNEQNIIVSKEVVCDEISRVESFTVIEKKNCDEDEKDSSSSSSSNENHENPIEVRAEEEEEETEEEVISDENNEEEEEENESSDIYEKQTIPKDQKFKEYELDPKNSEESSSTNTTNEEEEQEEPEEEEEIVNQEKQLQHDNIKKEKTKRNVLLFEGKSSHRNCDCIICCCCCKVTYPCFSETFKCLVMIIFILLKDGLTLWFSSSEFLDDSDIDSSNPSFVLLTTLMTINKYIIWSSIGIYLFILSFFILFFVERFIVDPLMFSVAVGCLREYIFYRIFKALFLTWFICINLFSYITKFSFSDSFEQHNMIRSSDWWLSIILPEFLLFYSLSEVINYNGVSSHAHLSRLKKLGVCGRWKFPKVSIGYSKLAKDCDVILEDFFQVIFLIPEDYNDKNGVSGRDFIKKLEESSEYGHLSWEFLNGLSFEEILYLKRFFFPSTFKKQDYLSIFYHDRMLSWKWISSLVFFPIFCCIGAKSL